MTSSIALKGSVFASRSGMMKEFCTAMASINNGKGRFNAIFTVLSSATPHSSTDFATVWPNVFRTAQRAANATLGQETGLPLTADGPKSLRSEVAHTIGDAAEQEKTTLWAAL